MAGHGRSSRSHPKPPNPGLDRMSRRPWRAGRGVCRGAMHCGGNRRSRPCGATPELSFGFRQAIESRSIGWVPTVIIQQREKFREPCVLPKGKRAEPLTAHVRGNIDRSTRVFFSFFIRWGLAWLIQGASSSHKQRLAAGSCCGNRSATPPPTQTTARHWNPIDGSTRPINRLFFHAI